MYVIEAKTNLTAAKAKTKIVQLTNFILNKGHSMYSKYKLLSKINNKDIYLCIFLDFAESLNDIRESIIKSFIDTSYWTSHLTVNEFNFLLNVFRNKIILYDNVTGQSYKFNFM